VLIETIWVLMSVYERNAKQIANAIALLLDHETLVIQDRDVVTRALAHLPRRPSLRFSDCLIFEAARKAGHLPLGSFDRGLARLDDVVKLRSWRKSDPKALRLEPSPSPRPIPSPEKRSRITYVCSGTNPVLCSAPSTAAWLSPSATTGRRCSTMCGPRRPTARFRSSRSFF